MRQRLAPNHSQQRCLKPRFEQHQSRRMPQRWQRASARPSPRCLPTSRDRSRLMEDLDPEDSRRVVDPALEVDDGRGDRYGIHRPIHGDGSSRCLARRVRMRIIRSAALLAALRMQLEIKKLARHCVPRARADPDSGRAQHRRGRGAPDRDWQAERRVHTHWPHGQSGIADADAGRARLGGGE